MKAPDVITLDFETEAIDDRPKYPPIPVGFSVQFPGDRRSRYYAWGHPLKNNCSKKDAARVLKDVWKSRQFILCHNTKFDYDVAQVHFGLADLPWERLHDTLYLLFLHNPHARSLSLKEAAHAILGMAPSERDAVRDWLVDHSICRKDDSKWGAHIAKAPGDIVGKYADGDVARTLKLFQKLWPEIHKRDMIKAYDRERHLMPILLRNERHGLRINASKLERDAQRYEDGITKADAWIRKRLKTPGLNVDSDKEIGPLLLKHNVVSHLNRTAKSGQYSVSKKNLTEDMFKDKKFFRVLGWRNRLSTCMNMFVRNWLTRQKDGRLYTSWNQVRQSHGFDLGMGGARTGRLSNTPPFLNIPTEFDEKVADISDIIDVPNLPYMREYILPENGHLWLKRDYSQQELRVLAHYEDGSFKQAYLDNPRMDAHEWVQGAVKDATGVEHPRKVIKIANLGDNYGMGMGKFAATLGLTMEEARAIRVAKRAAMSGFDSLDRGIKAMAAAGKPIRTWGGREYFCEAPVYNEEWGKWQKFDYKLLNYLIQGSSADCTKEAIIRYDEHPKREAIFLLAVHDEMDVSAPKGLAKKDMAVLDECMSSVEFDVQMLSDGEIGPNWHALKKVK